MMATHDITGRIAAFIDPHLVLPILDFLETKGVRCVVVASLVGHVVWDVREGETLFCCWVFSSSLAFSVGRGDKRGACTSR